MKKNLLLLLSLVFIFSCGKDGRLFFKPASLVITSTNDSMNNEVVGYFRDSDGTLDSIFTYSTQGKGINGPLRSQNSILWTKDGRFVLVCNAGSNDITVFSVQDDQLSFVKKVSSMGINPVSLTQYQNYIYVLNSGGHGTLSGFEINKDGELSPIPGIAIEIDSVNCGPAQASFTMDGSGIIVTCRITHKIIGFGISKEGLPISKSVISSNTQVPYGFDLDENGKIYVTEAKESGLSVYEWKNGKELVKLNDLTKDLHTAACWVKLTSNKKFAFVADADPRNIAGFEVSNSGSVTLLKSDGKSGTTEHTPTELAIVGNEYLYVSNVRSSSIEVFKIDGGGNLSKIQTLPGKGDFSWGIVAN
jgi:6-phosphogluconolactonase